MTLVATPASKRNDPKTSQIADQTITASGERARQQRIVEVLVNIWPESTSAELAAIANNHPALVAEELYKTDPSDKQSKRCQLKRQQIARRLPELASVGSVKRGESRECLVKGRKSIIWMPNHD